MDFQNSFGTFFAQVGLLLQGCTVDQLVVGGPAYNSGELDKGDEIVRVDGVAVDTDTLLKTLIGADAPGSTVTLHVHKGGPVIVQSFFCVSSSSLLVRVRVHGAAGHVSLFAQPALSKHSCMLCQRLRRKFSVILSTMSFMIRHALESQG